MERFRFRGTSDGGSLAIWLFISLYWLLPMAFIALLCLGFVGER